MALSNAERQARSRAKRDAEIERLREAAGKAAPVSQELAEARTEIERLRKAAVAPSSDGPELSEARKEIERLRSENAVYRVLLQAKQAKTAARKAKTAAADEAAAEQYADDDRATLLEKLVHADKQLAASKVRIKNLEAKVRYFTDRSPPRMSKRLHRQILGWLHPDRAHGDDAQRERLEKCFQEFSAIKFTFLDVDER